MKPSVRSGIFLQMIWIILFGHLVKRRVEDYNIYFFENHLVHQLRLKRFFSSPNDLDLILGQAVAKRTELQYFFGKWLGSYFSAGLSHLIWCDSVANDLDFPHLTISFKKVGLPPGLTYCKEKDQFFCKWSWYFLYGSPVAKRTIWYVSYLLQIIRNIL